MSRTDEIAAWLPGRLAELVKEHRVPAAQVAVLVDGEIVDAAAGVLNLATGVEATTDSVFQVGSVTKAWITAGSKALAVSAAVPGVLGVVQLHVYGEVLSEHFELPLTKNCTLCTWPISLAFAWITIL